MERFDQVAMERRTLKQEYQKLRDDYEIIKQNIASNLEAKKAMRAKMAILDKEYKELKAQQIPATEPKVAETPVTPTE
jgi:hypothetical protein